MKRIKIAIVGLHYGKHIIETQILSGKASDFFELTAVCSLEKDDVSEVAVRYGVRGFTDLDEMLREGDFECVGLFTGPAGRADQIKAIVRAGKDIITTKPFEESSSSAKKALRELVNLNKVLCTNSPYPIMPDDIKQIYAWIEKYDLGRAISAQCFTWANYREKHDGSWYDQRELCPVAPVFRIGIYALNDLIQLFGAIESVSVVESRIFTERPTPDNANMSLKFSNGLIANVLASFCIGDDSPYPDSMVLGFENGVIYRNVGPQAIWPRKEIEMTVQAKTVSDKIVTERKTICSEKLSGAYLWGNYYDMIKNREVPSPDYVERLLGSIKVFETVNRSYNLNDIRTDKVCENVEDYDLSLV
ncbi:Oxidoreductase family protein, NAD-binding Rossmann fold [Limihaloglobus sulfuriphilus]|uniref:Oxidoreductase family protein, NAD-binding Rossmann fold n=1 Tax=Limihaloglobus sulfuriphilus TaxID=1851148 RepID=A0A1Q2MF87_9BACT|nr:Gfo/Idh/MocA family oxidoreductase [Limihaloglobus sulfuriphilus]AQQ70957.1 Oxidoreductase family protein, NAD-binding Rossmann fold [Limihaloglobus sulfuriphilus]